MKRKYGVAERIGRRVIRHILWDGVFEFISEMTDGDMRWRRKAPGAVESSRAGRPGVGSRCKD